MLDQAIQAEKLPEAVRQGMTSLKCPQFLLLVGVEVDMQGAYMPQLGGKI